MTGVGVALLVISALCCAANAWAACADFARARFVLANAAELGLSERFVVLSGIPKGAAALGIGLGLADFVCVGVAASIGLVVFFLCALGLHLYRRALRKIIAPLIFELLAVGALVYFWPAGSA